jgi:hypothetical protein
MHTRHAHEDDHIDVLEIPKRSALQFIYSLFFSTDFGPRSALPSFVSILIRSTPSATYIRLPIVVLVRLLLSVPSF